MLGSPPYCQLTKKEDVSVLLTCGGTTCLRERQVLGGGLVSSHSACYCGDLLRVGPAMNVFTGRL